MTLINNVVFERQMSGKPILFETFFDPTIPGEYCTGFTLTVNQCPAHPADTAVMRQLEKLISRHDIGVHLECTDSARKIHFGIAGTPCFDPERHEAIIPLAEIELFGENTLAFDWLCGSSENDEHEDAVFCSWPHLQVSITENTYYELQAEIPYPTLDPPLQTNARAGAIVRLFVQTAHDILLSA